MQQIMLESKRESNLYWKSFQFCHYYIFLQLKINIKFSNIYLQSICLKNVTFLFELKKDYFYIDFIN